MTKKKKEKEPGLTPEELEARARSLEENSVLLDATISAFGNRARIAAELIVASDADPSMIHASKTLFECDEMKAVGRHLRKTREKIVSFSVPSVFRGGVYLCSIDAVRRIDDFLVNATRKLSPLLDALVAKLPEAMEDARKRLTDRLFDPSDYPSAATLRSLFGIRWRWVSISTPDRLSSVSGNLLERELSKARSAVEESVAELTDLLRGEFAELVSHLVERLGTDEKGKPRVFKQASIKNLGEFVEFFDLRNVASDAELRELVEKTKALLSGVDPSELREEMSVRNRTKKAFAEIAKSVETLPKPVRRFDWSDDAKSA